MKREITKWEDFLFKTFGIRLGVKVCGIPVGIRDVVNIRSNPNLKELLFMPARLSLKEIIEKTTRLMPVEIYLEEDEIPKVSSVRRASENEPYAIWHSGSEEADIGFRNYSAMEIKGSFPFSPLSLAMTIEERLLLELYNFINKRHMDQETITLCAGSECRLGGVPSVEWRQDRLVINIHHPINSKDPQMGIRLVEPAQLIYY